MQLGRKEGIIVISLFYGDECCHFSGSILAITTLSLSPQDLLYFPTMSQLPNPGSESEKSRIFGALMLYSQVAFLKIKIKMKPACLAGEKNSAQLIDTSRQEFFMQRSLKI